jgi:hypothetical protein
MLRSVLARPHLLLSHLLRHDCRSGALLGRRADQIISQSRSYTSSEEDETDSDADRPEATLVAPNCTSPKQRKGHLYVVLDDWKKGFSIHKLDLDDGSDGSRDLTLRPPVYRQATECFRWNFAAVGSKIVAAGEITNEGHVHGKEDNGVTLVYDTETAAMSIVPRLPTALRVPWFLATAARNGMYAFDGVSKKNTQYNVSMYHLEEAPPPTASDACWWGTNDHWSWKSIPSQPPLNTYGVGMMKSIAVHPEGGERTIFVSVGCSDSNRGQTYSYDVQSQEWKDHGDWGLPFHGQADYDTELDAWVGLHNRYESRSTNLDGYICSCDVVSPSGSSPRPASKLCKERLFDPNTQSPSLLYMGDSTYCIVKVEELERYKSSRCAGRGNGSMISLSMFRLKYNKNGELTITARQPDRSYLFSRYMSSFKVSAFWM